jgi:hypothetical protein
MAGTWFLACCDLEFNTRRKTPLLIQPGLVPAEKVPEAFAVELATPATKAAHENHARQKAGPRN